MYSCRHTTSRQGYINVHTTLPICPLATKIFQRISPAIKILLLGDFLIICLKYIAVSCQHKNEHKNHCTHRNQYLYVLQNQCTCDHLDVLVQIQICQSYKHSQCQYVSYEQLVKHTEYFTGHYRTVHQRTTAAF